MAYAADAILDDLDGLAERLSSVSGDADARGDAALAFFVERHGDEGAHRFAVASRILRYVEEHEAELRRIGLLVHDPEVGWRIDPRLIESLVR
jgi:hypothetical protein